ncbi:MAG: hypothetical protein ACAH59_05370 [Pseudobdellovibrionaceae bacterium]
MKTWILVLGLLIGFSALARPAVRYDEVAFSESFGPKLSSQILSVDLPSEGTLRFSGERGQMGFGTFDYYIGEIHFLFEDGSGDSVVVNRWFQKTLLLPYKFSKSVRSLTISAQHDDRLSNGNSHRLTVSLAR